MQYIYIYILRGYKMQNELYENVTDTKHQSLEFRETNLKWTAMVTYLDSGIEVNQSSP